MGQYFYFILFIHPLLNNSITIKTWNIFNFSLVFGGSIGKSLALRDKESSFGICMLCRLLGYWVFAFFGISFGVNLYAPFSQFMRHSILSRCHVYVWFAQRNRKKSRQEEVDDWRTDWLTGERVAVLCYLCRHRYRHMYIYTRNILHRIPRWRIPTSCKCCHWIPFRGWGWNEKWYILFNRLSIFFPYSSLVNFFYIFNYFK